MIKLRPANITNHEAIAALHAQSWRLHYRGIYSDTFLDNEVHDNRRALWRERLSTPKENQRVIMALDDGAVTGFACLYLDDHPALGTLLDNLHVLDRHRKSGIGRRLLRECAGIIAAEAVQPAMYLWVYKQNGNAVKVYEHLGGRCAETITKQNADGGTAVSHRYVWDDVAVLAT